MNLLQAKVNELPVPAFVAGVAAAGRVRRWSCPLFTGGYPFGHDVLREMRCCRSQRGCFTTDVDTEYS